MMNVGLPGTGLGGMFYLAIAMATPVIETCRTVTRGGQLQGWRTSGKMVLTAVSIFGALWGTAFLTAAALPTPIVEYLQSKGQHAIDAVGASPSLITVSTLLGILLAVEVAAIAHMVIASPKRAES